MLQRRSLLTRSARALVLAGVCSLLPLGAATAAEAGTDAAKRALAYSDYAPWRSIQGAVLSRDGRFAAYALVGQESDGELVVRRLADGQEWRVPRGLQPVFSADSRFLAFAQAPTRAAQDQARKDKKKGDDAPKPGAGWLDLDSGRFETVDRVKRVAFAEDGGSRLALWLEAPAKPDGKTDAKSDTRKAGTAPADDDGPDQIALSETGFFGASHASAEAGRKKDAGTALLLVNPADGQRQRLEDVSAFAWSRDGLRLAFAVTTPAPKDTKDSKAPKDAKPPRDGVYLLAGTGGEPRLLLGGRGAYRQLQFDDAGRQLAFVSNRDHLAQDAGAERKEDGKGDGKDDAKAPATPFKLYHWRADEAGAVELLAAGNAGLREGFSPSEHASLRFSKDGRRLFLGTAPLPPEPAKDAPEPLKVDLWHWQDPELQSMQKVRAEKERLRSYRAVVHLDLPAERRFVQLATPELPEVVVNDNADFALGFNELPYRALQSWDTLYRDAYAVSLKDGSTRLLARRLRGMPLLSPGGRYVTAFLPEKKQWMAWRTQDGSARALTAGIAGEHFENVERDVVEPADAYGQVGWLPDDRAVVLNAQFDLWSVDPESLAAKRLTPGINTARPGAASPRIQLRLQRVDDEGGDRTEREEQRHARPLPAGPWILLGTAEQDKSTAFYRIDPAGTSAPERLLHRPQLLGGLVKARDAEVWLHTAQDFRTFPDLWLSQGPLGQGQRLSDANPQQARLRWGTQEIIGYTSAKGRPLRALLAKPEDFDPRKKYPLMVYIYEKMTDNLHRYVPPAPGQNINVSRYVSKGYLVLRPDIVYTIGHPGQSAMDTVIPAIQQLVKQGFVDEKRIGIQGHSWGAYQVNHLLTRTTMFRAAEAGASMANMISGYGGIRWGTGRSRAFQYEQQQSRIGATPWQRPDLYVENSPIFRIDRITTPYLTVHNDEDDAVPYYQAIEFFTALRRLGKEAYWFNYNGEKHGLRDRDALKHFTVHMGEFFDHYLLGEPRPAWMDQPVPYLERGKRDVMPLFKPVAERIPVRAPVIEDPSTPPPQPLQTR
ncbi:prolyl oligopeptidase family serine peptidase [Pelomonas sp. APW6]|uniref:Prolyl oligopeptidase family serine peptidase n=1 Tax=Roseateles subflavus TaxID=3053353 RepID=A0ABT7LF51_9BURK|nr:prolyl oligopeptidase family serine peptidase [Pelomonas sp. APW6]MDL5031476.1 prolyl oligopeptidase family serine peptidase [Pelomonas sp. APW6]